MLVVKNNFLLFALTLVMVGYSVFFILPHWSVDPQSRNFEIDTYQGYYFDERRMTSGRRSRKEKRLNLKMSSGKTWQLTAQENHWEQLIDSSNMGRSFKIYPSAAIPRNLNPGRIEIEGQIVYSFDEKHLNGYMILLITTTLFLGSAWRIWRFYH